MVTLDGDRVRFTHPMIGSVITTSVSPAQRRGRHLALAESVDDPEEAVRHLALAQVGPDRAVAARVDEAVAFAAARGATSSAAELAERALELTPPDDPARRVDRQIVAARYWAAAGDLDRAEALVRDALRTAPSGPPRSRARQVLATLVRRRADFEGSYVLAAQALAECGDSADRRASLELDLTFAASTVGDVPRSCAHAERAVEAATAEGGADWLPEALSARTMARFMAGDGLDTASLDEAVALAESAPPPRRRGDLATRPRYVEGILQLWVGRVADARDTLAAVHDDVVENGEESAVPLVSMFRVWAELWSGDLAEADRLAGAATETAALLGDPLTDGLAGAAQALVYAFDGRRAFVERDARASLERFEQHPYSFGAICSRWALGLAALGDGDLEAAETALGPVGDVVVSLRTDPVLGVFVPDEIEALVGLGRLERAESLLVWFEDAAQRVDRTYALAAAGRCRGLVLAARGDFRGAGAAFARALDCHDVDAIPFERARTQLALGKVLRRQTKRARAHGALAEALATFDRIGTSAWAKQARSEIERLGARVSRPTELTATESTVARFAAEGLSNREIADRAFLSVKAVEANLTRVYRKLGIRSRVELARDAGNGTDGSSR